MVAAFILFFFFTLTSSVQTIPEVTFFVSFIINSYRKGNGKNTTLASPAFNLYFSARQRYYSLDYI